MSNGQRPVAPPQAAGTYPQPGYPQGVPVRPPNSSALARKALACGIAAWVLSVLTIVEQHLYTPLGLHTLSPRNPMYKGQYAGDQPTRDAAYHQGTIWTWLLEPYFEAVERVWGEAAALKTGKEILKALEKEMHRYGVGTIGEVFDGDPPHAPGGTIAQAWSVAAAMRILRKVQSFEAKGKKGGI